MKFKLKLSQLILKLFSWHPDIYMFLVKKLQPKWCDYPEAFTPIFGCWSLTVKGMKVPNCVECELYKFKETHE